MIVNFNFNVGDFVTFDFNNHAVSGVVVGFAGDNLRVATINTVLFELARDTVIKATGNYFDSPQLQRAWRELSTVNH